MVKLHQFYQLKEPPLAPTVQGVGNQGEVLAELFEKLQITLKDFLSPVNFRHVRKILRYDSLHHKTVYRSHCHITF